MSGFPALEDITVETGIAWCLAALTFFEEACRSGDIDQLQAAGIIGYGLHNLPQIILQLQENKRSMYSVYGDMSHRSGNSQTKAFTRSFFEQDIPAVALPQDKVLPDMLAKAMYSTMQAFRVGFRPGNAFATEEGWDERRQDCLRMAAAMKTHLLLWIADEEFDAETFRRDGGWLQ